MPCPFPSMHWMNLFIPFFKYKDVHCIALQMCEHTAHNTQAHFVLKRTISHTLLLPPRPALLQPPTSRWLAGRGRPVQHTANMLVLLLTPPPTTDKAARQNNVLCFVAMTIRLCHGGVCKSSIRCLMATTDSPPPPCTVPRQGDREVSCPKSPWCQRRQRRVFLWLCCSCGGKVRFASSRMERGRGV